MQAEVVVCAIVHFKFEEATHDNQGLHRGWVSATHILHKTTRQALANLWQNMDWEMVILWHAIHVYLPAFALGE